MAQDDDEKFAKTASVVASSGERHSSRGKRVWLLMALLSGAALGGAIWVRLGDDAASGSQETTRRPPVSVVVDRATRGTIPLIVKYRGELDTEVAELAAQGSGRLLDVRLNLGDTFKKGDVLAKVDAAETRRLFAEAQAQVGSQEAEKQRVLAELETARAEAERGKKLLAERLISDQELASLEARVKVLQAGLSAAEAQRAAALARVALYREQLSQAELKAPFAGAVGRRYLDVGATVAPGTPVLRLVRGGPLHVRFRASEAHVNRLKPDTPLTVTTLGTGDAVFAGHLERISAEVNRTDRSLEAEGVLEEEHSSLRPGMYANVEVSLGKLEDVVLVQAAALRTEVDAEGKSERFLFVIEGDRASSVPVEVLGEHGKDAAVRGIEPEAQVVVQGQDLLSEGAQVKKTEAKSP